MSDQSPNNQLTSKSLRAINDACDMFEDRWNGFSAGAEPRLQDVLNEFRCQTDDNPDSVKAALCRGLIEVDREARSRRYLSAARSQYEACIPVDLHFVLDEIDWSKLSGGIPIQIGNYRILRLIGKGGMGHVYMAQQDEPFNRRVAVKVISTDSPTKEVLVRFEAERQALAMMDHEHIARIFDAGVDPAGRPYFVMELVKNGIPITEYCDQNRLTPHQRLELLIQACRAIQHAHMKGIIHRDLKPSNVLVTEHEGKPIVKVIDFGLAKAIHDTTRLTNLSLLTAHGLPVGTLAYMSPEQARLNAMDVDTRTDVYSLGVILYELLTGTTPITKARLESEAFDSILSLIREEDAVLPSRRLSDSGEAITGISKLRRIEPKRLNRILKGDLDWITLKALEKSRPRRYDSPSALAADLQRFVAGEPVEARRPSFQYLTLKLLKKHRVICGVAAILIAVFAAWAAQFMASVRLSRANERLLEETQLISTELLSEHVRFDAIAKPHSNLAEGLSMWQPTKLTDADIAAMSDVIAKSRARRAKFWIELGAYLGSNENLISNDQSIKCMTFAIADLDDLVDKIDSRHLREVYCDAVAFRGLVYGRTRRAELAAEDHRLVLGILEKDDREKSSPTLKLKIATTYFNLSRNVADVKSNLQTALSILEPQLHSHPESINVYARCCHNLEPLTQDNAEAISILQKGEMALKSQAPANSRDLMLAWFYDALGRRSGMSGNRSQSAEYRRKAIELSEQYLKIDVGSLEWSKILCRTKYNLAISGCVDDVEAAQLFEQITNEYRPIIQARAAAEYDTVHVNSLLNTGISKLSKRKPLSAVQYLSTARTLMQESKSTDYLLETRILELTAQSLVAPEDALLQFDNEIDLSKSDGSSFSCYHAARICVRAAVVSSQMEQKDELRERAIAYLLTARKSKSWSPSLKKDFDSEPDFDVIRSDQRIIENFNEN